MSYFNRMMGGDGFFGRVYYEGGSRLKWVKVGAMYSGYFERKFVTATSTWDGTSLSITNVQFAAESHARYDSDLGDQGGYAELKLGRPNVVRDDQGLVRSHEYGSNGQIYFTRFSDSTFEAFCYNDQGQITRHRDRLGRVTRNSYDARGNLLLKEVGLQDDPSNVTGDSNGADYGGETYNRCALDDVQTPEYATYQWEYFPAGHANQFLLSAQIDANGNRTDYEYDAQQRLTKVIQPPDAPAGSRAATLFAYDAAGRLQTITDPEGHVTEQFYDGRNRVTQVLYEDGTTERLFYGTGNNAGLLVKSVDRRNVVTNYEYDLAGRKTRTVTAAALMDLAGNESPVSDPSVTVEEVCTYVPGTDLRASCVTAGDKTSYEYDYKNRLVATTVYPNANKTLTSQQHYVNNQLFASEDPYGRKKFFAYDATDGRLIRQIQGTVPSVSYADNAAVLNKVRDPDGTPNSTSIIQDLLYDAEGQTTSMFDGRGIEHRTAYDSRGRTTEQIQAFGTAVAAKTQTLYDANGNVLETRAPRYFDTNDTEGFQKCRTTMTYTGRNKLKTRTEAPGTPITATESFSYDIAGRQTSHLDFRGNEWKTQHPDCCGQGPKGQRAENVRPS